MPTTKAQYPTVPFTPFVPSFARDAEEIGNRVRRFFHEPFGRFFEPFGTEFMTQQVGYYPVVGIFETADGYFLTAELPGMTKKDVKVEFDNGALTFSGEKFDELKEGNGDRKFLLWERSYGAFKRSFTFPSGIIPEKITAEFTNGVLKIFLPKMAEAKPKGVKIEVVEKSK